MKENFDIFLIVMALLAAVVYAAAISSTAATDLPCPTAWAGW